MPGFNFNLSDDDPKELEKGSNVPPGWYRCQVAEVYDDAQNPGTIVFKHQVQSGPFAGYTIYDRLYDSTNAADTDKAEFCRRPQVLYAKRLGVVKDDQFGGEASGEWEDSIGTEVAVKVTVKKGKDENGAATERIGV